MGVSVQLVLMSEVMSQLRRCGVGASLSMKLESLRISQILHQGENCRAAFWHFSFVLDKGGLVVMQVGLPLSDHMVEAQQCCSEENL